MANITFTESSMLNDPIFGKLQAPIKMFLEKRAEAFEEESVVKHIFQENTSTHWAEAYTSMTGMDDFQAVPENGAYPKNGMQSSYTKQIKNVTWKSQFQISMEAVEDDQMNVLKGRPAGFMTAYDRTRERFGAALLGAAINKQDSIQFNGMTFETTGADGVCLFKPSHPSKVSKKVQSNQFQDAFSDDAMAAMESAMQDFRGEKDEVLAVSPDTIIIPNDYVTKKAVFAAVGADKDPDTANNGFNFLFGRWRIIVWQYLNQFINTKSQHPWIMMDSKYNEENGSAIWQTRKALEMYSWRDNNTDANVWNGNARFSAGFNDWRAFAVGGVSGGTQLIGG